MQSNPGVFIRGAIEHSPDQVGGLLRFTVEDDGPGFDHARVFAPLQDNVSFFGRGIPLLKSICDRLVYSGSGNHVEAVYRWGSDGATDAPD